MQIIRRDIEYHTLKEPIEIVPLGDIHYGNVGCDVHRLREVIKYIADNPNCYAVGLGDYIDAVTPGDVKRFDPTSYDPKFTFQDLGRIVSKEIEDIIELLKPIKGKLIACICGNHEETAKSRYFVDGAYDIAKAMECPYLGYDGFIQLRFIGKYANVKRPPSRLFNIYVSHGFGASRKSSPKIQKIEDICSFMGADLVMIGHDHKKVCIPPLVRLYADRAGKLQQKKQYGVMCGSFLKGYVMNASTYVERACYHPSDLGTVYIKIHPESLKVSITI